MSDERWNVNINIYVDTSFIDKAKKVSNLLIKSESKAQVEAFLQAFAKLP